MKRLLIVAEGQTEELFVKKHLQPYLQSQGLMNLVQCHRIKSTGGGLVRFHQLEADLCRDLRGKDVVVSTMIDLYALPGNFPNYHEAMQLSDHLERVEFLENRLKDYLQSKMDIALSHFIPNIQLHEFESLLFASERGFELFDEQVVAFPALQKVMAAYPNPETINDGKETAPSKRMQKLVQGYNKVVDGNAMIERIGMRTVLEKCPHFSKWVNSIIASLAQED